MICRLQSSTSGFFLPISFLQFDILAFRKLHAQPPSILSIRAKITKIMGTVQWIPSIIFKSNNKKEVTLELFQIIVQHFFIAIIKWHQPLSFNNRLATSLTYGSRLEFITCLFTQVEDLMMSVNIIKEGW